MGLSGTLMLAHRAPDLETYYEPGKEFIWFESLEECAELARFYLRHEQARRTIAEAYARRTLAEHLWEHRIRRILQETGLS
jgi:spore maturation protein CgeB